MQHHLFTQFRCSRRQPRHSTRGGGIPALFIPRVSPSCSLADRCSDTIVDSVEDEPHVDGRTQHLARKLAVPNLSPAAEVKVFMDSGSSTTAMSEELVRALRGQPGDDANRVNAGVCWACACGEVRWVRSVILSRNPYHSTSRSKRHGDQSNLPCRLSCFLGEVMWFIIGQKTLKENLGVDVMAQLKASVPKAQGRQDGAGIELTDRSVGEPSHGAVLWRRLSPRLCRVATRGVTWMIRSH